jgi:hypothetical protein
MVKCSALDYHTRFMFTPTEHGAARDPATETGLFLSCLVGLCGRTRASDERCHGDAEEERRRLDRNCPINQATLARMDLPEKCLSSSTDSACVKNKASGSALSDVPQCGHLMIPGW